MKTLLLASFFIVVFIPMNKGYEWVIWVLILAMLGLVALYYWMIYGVRENQARTCLHDNEPLRYSIFSGLVTGSEKLQDIQRGRLVFTDTRLVFICRNNSSFEVVWETEITSLTSYNIGKVLSFRKGIIFFLHDESEYSFTISRINKREPQIKQALGWE